MQRFNKNGNIEEFHFKPQSPLEVKSVERIVKHSKCYSCEIASCFYRLHATELPERVLTDCERLTTKRSPKYLLRSQGITEAIQIDVSKEIDKRIKLTDPDMPDSEERQRLLKILFDKIDE